MRRRTWIILAVVAVFFSAVVLASTRHKGSEEPAGNAQVRVTMTQADYEWAIQQVVSLKMEYAYKEGQKDAINGVIKIKLLGTNEGVAEGGLVDVSGMLGQPGMAKREWEWTGTPWGDGHTPYPPDLVDANNDANILTRLAIGRSTR